ncbi:helix-turn-helix transcriptional regulator [Limosilactobacillus sp. STM2_1]|uniref:Helix-turn-helix transcriptional regulator n=1 Tax=Limosilactobacillus rudii TaxID=2759755 RepID=A0A7W3YMT9_9LACO|nr:AraC family transcriptional regulator [Limosilactobacillus rudii]MBB1078502.1 helix-turn-helix transcriptional regulator [Limosilactobacillus rudii]MBB1096632.1 helix-turn-helix transcriptional regulator [Limosilactobacillus rudii]MCD7134172.1 AraC family transcriptional regulator [Limosilactobacillus rudii]
MKLKSLHLTSDLYENVKYDEHAIPLVTCIDNFDEYVSRQWSPHWHEGFEMTTVLHGICQYTIINNSHKENIKLTPGDGIFVNSGVLHSVKALKPQTKTACLVLPPTFFNFKSFEILRKNSISPILNSGVSEITWRASNKQESVITQGITELCQLSDADPDYELQSVELICRIWRLMAVQFRKSNQKQLSFTPNTQANRVRAAIQYIHENYHRPGVTANEIANAINISRAECFRSFKAIVNQTPIEYLNEYRMTMAEMMLTTTSRTVKEISTMCGYNTSSYFSSEFKKKYGTTPKQYRKLKH